MLQDEQNKQDNMDAWFGDGRYFEPSPALQASQKENRHSSGLLAHIFLHVGETLIAISLYEFILRFLPEIIKAIAELL